MNTNLPILNTILPSQALAPSPVDTSAASTYTDLNGLAALKKDPTSPQAISAVAEQVEALFLQMMLKSMRDASVAGEQDSNEMGVYQDMFDKQVALTISQHQDLGIGALLKRQTQGKTAPAAPKSNSSAASAPPPVTAQTPAEFVDQVMPTIRRAAGALGVDPLGLLAQAALESGWGQRMPHTADGASSFNLFGIKAGEEWTGARVITDTMEFSHGVATQRRTAFRAYGSIEESVADFANLLKNSPRYRNAVAAGGNAQAYVDGIGKSGYATDPGYANKLNQILKSSTLQAAITPRTAAL
jgi:peptidoglycan hydrolase FlgJ